MALSFKKTPLPTFEEMNSADDKEWVHAINDVIANPPLRGDVIIPMALTQYTNKKILRATTIMKWAAIASVAVSILSLIVAVIALRNTGCH